MFKNSIKLMSLLLLAGLVVFSSCKKEDDDPPPVIVLDGAYVVGGATGATSPNANGIMSVARNEVLQEDRAALKEVYIAIQGTAKGGSDGFNIVVVEGATTTTYGPGTDFALVSEAELDIEEPQAGLWRGSLVETADKFTVTEDGLYHVMFDSELMIAAIAKVEWGIIGAATPGGWSGSTALLSGGFDLNTMTFEETNLVITKADWKFRYSDGWKIILDTSLVVGDDKKGVKVNTNFGGAVDNLVPGGDNISNDVPAYYTMNMTWTLGAGNAAEMTKTGDLEVVDYTNAELGLVGDGFMYNGVQHNWDETVMLHVPVVEDVTNYTWTYEGVEVTTLGSFKIREGQTWDDKVIGYTEVTMAGLSADKFETNNDGNFVPLDDGVYDMVLFIDAITEEYTFTVNPAGVTTELYMLGDATAAGWDNTIAIPLDGTGGLYTITTDLLGGGNIKFITILGQWQPQYGTDATGTSAGGPLFVNDGTGTDPDNIPGPDAGTYLITVNTNDMVYTIVAAK